MTDQTVPITVTRIRQFFTNRTAGAKKRRSNAGLLLALLMLPLLLGVLACLPVPVGNPEKSRIDPALSGAWVLTDSDGGYMFIVLDPYDKRTWLLSLIGLNADLSDESDKPAAEQDEAAIEESQRLPFTALDASRFRVEEVGVYKCWLTRIGGETFMTWESKTLSGTAPGEKPEYWWVFRVRKTGVDSFYLDNFDYSVDDLKNVSTSREAEKIIRRHVGDPGFFKEEDAMKLQRLAADDFKAMQSLLKDFGIDDNL